MASPVISFQDYGFQYMAQAEPTLRHINLDIYSGEKVLICCLMSLWRIWIPPQGVLP